MGLIICSHCHGYGKKKRELLMTERGWPDASPPRCLALSKAMSAKCRKAARQRAGI